MLPYRYPVSWMNRLVGLAFVAFMALGCRRTTADLSPDLVSRFAAESVLHRADDQVFRYTYYSRSTRGTRWEDRDASIIVTRQSIFIHKNAKVGLDLTSASRKANAVRREGDRVIVSSGSGQSKVSWSFRPPDDADAWARDIRAVLSTTPPVVP